MFISGEGPQSACDRIDGGNTEPILAEITVMSVRNLGLG